MRKSIVESSWIKNYPFKKPVFPNVSEAVRVGNIYKHKPIYKWLGQYKLVIYTAMGLAIHSGVDYNTVGLEGFINKFYEPEKYFKNSLQSFKIKPSAFKYCINAGVELVGPSGVLMGPELDIFIQYIEGLYNILTFNNIDIIEVK